MWSETNKPPIGEVPSTLHPYYIQQESLMEGTTVFDVSGGDGRLPLTADTQP